MRSSSDEEEDDDEEEEESEEEEEVHMVDKYAFRADAPSRLGTGAFAAVYAGTNVRTGERVAIKTESVASDVGLLKHEIRMYMRLRGTPGLFLPKWYGVSGPLRCLVLPRGPPSLAAIMENRSEPAPDFAIQLLHALVCVLEALHARGVVHRDVKPANVLVLVGEAPDALSVTLIDLGLSAPWPSVGAQARPRALIGSPAFASMSAHALRPHAPQQDVEAACYVAAYAQGGGALPWRTTADTAAVRAFFLGGPAAAPPLCHPAIVREWVSACAA